MALPGLKHHGVPDKIPNPASSTSATAAGMMNWTNGLHVAFTLM